MIRVLDAEIFPRLEGSDPGRKAAFASANAFIALGAVAPNVRDLRRAKSRPLPAAFPLVCHADTTAAADSCALLTSSTTLPTLASYRGLPLQPKRRGTFADHALSDGVPGPWIHGSIRESFWVGPDC
jgi:hypothetical protein